MKLNSLLGIILFTIIVGMGYAVYSNGGLEDLLGIPDLRDWFANMEAGTDERDLQTEVYGSNAVDDSLSWWDRLINFMLFTHS